jgi:NAD(P)-dependent dehydrogenase (short-subunit alcohol dehydrogenase family)
MYDLSGKAAIVTGGASGIGRDIAMRLAREGCRVGLFDRDEGRLAETVEQIGAAACAQTGDVTEAEEVRAAAAAFSRELGDIDILVNSAGILRIGLLLEQSREDFVDQFRVNVEGIFHWCQAVVPGMAARRRGKVINMASWLGKRGMKHYGGYCASKFAVIGYSQTLALEVADRGVNVNCVCPGTIIDTDMREQAERVHVRIGFPSAQERTSNIPLGRLGLPEDVSRLTAFLASSESDYMTGQALNVSGGLWLS